MDGGGAGFAPASPRRRPGAELPPALPAPINGAADEQRHHRQRKNVPPISHTILPRRHCRNAYTNSVLPAAIATYCLPATEYDIGPAETWPPTLPFHSSAPVRASSAKK